MNNCITLQIQVTQQDIDKFKDLPIGSRNFAMQEAVKRELRIKISYVRGNTIFSVPKKNVFLSIGQISKLPNRYYGEPFTFQLTCVPKEVIKYCED